MAITIVCPECGNKSKAPPEVQGKKIRCKSCGAVFGVRAAAPKPAPPRKGKAKGEDDLKEVEVKSFAQQMIEEEFKDDDSNPYAVTGMDLRPRCPHCAMAMEDGQVICLECGYNTQTRMHGATVRVMGATVTERLRWLAPGIACVLAVGGLVTLIFWLWMGLEGATNRNQQDSWFFWFVSGMGVFPMQVYGTFFTLVAIWFTGMFAIRRLILHPNPPDKVKR